MATRVVMPQMGESLSEGTVTKWFKKVGERVERDEPLFEISTDKVDAEIPAPAAGGLKEVKVKGGGRGGINTVVAVLEEGGGTASAEAPGVRLPSEASAKAGKAAEAPAAKLAAALPKPEA